MRKIIQTYKYLSDAIGDHEARIILKERAGLDWASILANPEQQIDADLILQDLTERLEGKPLSKIYGKKEFWGIEFNVNECVLDPRPDSETLIEVALNYYKDKKPPERILDLGTGSGCLLLTLLNEFPQAQGVGVDLCEDALAVAQSNAETLNLCHRVRFVQSEWAKNINEEYDLVISNPPYIASNVIPNLEKEVKNHDPILALDGGEDGLKAYHDIFSDLFRILKEDGIALFEIGFDQADDMLRLSKKYKIRLGDIYSDLAGNPRVVDMFKQ